MALSRQAKRFREQEPQQTTTPTRTKKFEKKPVPAAPPQVIAAPPPEPAAPPEPPKPGKRSQEKPPKPAKFVYVATKSERKPLAPKPVVQPPPVTKLAARMMTQNLALPPEEEPGRTVGLPGFGRV